MQVATRRRVAISVGNLNSIKLLFSVNIDIGGEKKVIIEGVLFIFCIVWYCKQIDKAAEKRKTEDSIGLHYSR